nr:MAG TPA: hypothetical protein [Caudoviricetes sp.]
MSDIKEHLVAALLGTKRGRGSILNRSEGYYTTLILKSCYGLIRGV